MSTRLLGTIEEGARRGALLLALTAFGTFGCSDPVAMGGDGGQGGGPDLGAADLVTVTTQTACGSEPITDGQACGAGCAADTLCAGYDNKDLRCYQTCDLTTPSCPCGRRCVAIALQGGGQGAACLPANGPGERCGTSPSATPYGYGACEQGQVCAGPEDARYCVSLCMTSTDCAAQTSCKDVVNNMMVGDAVCWFNSSPTGKAVGEACDLQTFCAPNTLCAGGACRQQCGGPADPSCSTGTCTPLKSGDRLFAYVCM